MDKKVPSYNEMMRSQMEKRGHVPPGSTSKKKLQILRYLLVLTGFCFIVFLILALGWLVITLRTQSDIFRKKMASSLVERINAEECALGNIKQESNGILISFMSATGSDKSFYNSVKSKNIRIKKNFTEGLFGKWKADLLSIETIEIKIKSGEENDQNAKDSFSSLFKKSDNFSFEGIQSNSVNIYWGNHKDNKGSIKGTILNASRNADQWEITLEGGTLTQNWLSGYQIEKITIICDQEGFRITEGIITPPEGSGEIVFNLNVGEGAQPEVSGVWESRSMSLGTLIPGDMSSWLTGEISGSGTIKGNLNKKEGIVYDAELFLPEGEKIIMRDKFSVFKPMQMIDPRRNYKKITFDKGGCNIHIENSTLKVESLDFLSENLFHLKADFTAKFPSHFETAQNLGLKDTEQVKTIAENYAKKNISSENRYPPLQERLRIVSKSKKELLSELKGNERTYQESLKTFIIEDQSSPRFKGTMHLGFQADAFKKTPKINKIYSIDPSTKKAWIPCAMNGEVDTLTNHFAAILSNTLRESHRGNR